MDVFHSIQEFIVNYEINLDKNNSEKIAIYNSIVTIMKTMIDADNGKHILDIISPNFNKIKENINKIKELPEVNLNYLAIDLLIFKSLIFIYYQMNKIPNLNTRKLYFILFVNFNVTDLSITTLVNILIAVNTKNVYQYYLTHILATSRIIGPQN